MDDIYDFANYQATLHAEISKIKLWKTNALIYSINGGTFSITPEMISFVNSMIALGKNTLIIEDRNENPIKIDNLTEFGENIGNIYFSVMNGFYIKIDKVKSSRSTYALANK